MKKPKESEILLTSGYSLLPMRSRWRSKACLLMAFYFCLNTFTGAAAGTWDWGEVVVN